MEELKKVLDIVLYKVVNEDNDYFLVIVGEVRKGKSNLALLIATYLMPKFPLENVVYNRAQFIKRVMTSKPGDVIIVDEGALVFFAKDRGKEMQDIIKMATTMGEKNLIVITCVPKITLIEKYIRQDRMKTFIQVFTRNGEKGYYAFFGKRATKKKIQQEERGYLRKGERKPQYMFRERFGKFPDVKFFDEYRKRKAKYTEVKIEESEESEIEIEGITPAQARKILGVKRVSLNRLRESGEIEAFILPSGQHRYIKHSIIAYISRYNTKKLSKIDK